MVSQGGMKLETRGCSSRRSKVQGGTRWGRSWGTSWGSRTRRGTSQRILAPVRAPSPAPPCRPPPGSLAHPAWGILVKPGRWHFFNLKPGRRCDPRPGSASAPPPPSHGEECSLYAPRQSPSNVLYKHLHTILMKVFWSNYSHQSILIKVFPSKYSDQSILITVFS